MGLYYQRGGLAAALPLAEHLGLLPPGTAASALAGAAPGGGTAAALRPPQPGAATGPVDSPAAAKYQAWLEVGGASRLRSGLAWPEPAWPACLAVLANCQLPPLPRRLHRLHPPSRPLRAQGARGAVQSLLGCRVRSGPLLREALTHCSWPVGPCYQRLEFLGDALLDLCASDIIWREGRWVGRLGGSGRPRLAGPLDRAPAGLLRSLAAGMLDE